MITFIRTGGKYNSNCNIKGAYKRYVTKSQNPVSYKVYSDICKSFNEFAMLDIICRGAEVDLGPIGTLSVRKYKCKPRMYNGKLSVNNLAVDYKATKEWWEKNPEARANKKLIRLFNDHTNNFRYRFFWDKILPRIINKSYYSFIPTRASSRRLASVLKDTNVEIDFYLDVAKMRQLC